MVSRLLEQAYEDVVRFADEGMVTDVLRLSCPYCEHVASSECPTCEGCGYHDGDQCEDCDGSGERRVCRLGLARNCRFDHGSGKPIDACPWIREWAWEEAEVYMNDWLSREEDEYDD
jgi:hypothetical protein